VHSVVPKAHGLSSLPSATQRVAGRPAFLDAKASLSPSFSALAPGEISVEKPMVKDSVVCLSVPKLSAVPQRMFL
jgi:hypothetical protein